MHIIFQDAAGKKVRVFNFHPIDCYRCEVDRHFTVLSSDEAEQLEKINNNALTAKLSKFVGIKKLVKKADLSEIVFAEDGDVERTRESRGGSRRVKDENEGDDDDAVRGGSELKITGDDNGDDNTALEHAYNDDDMEDIVEEDGLEAQEFDDDDDHQLTNDELARLDQSLESQVLHENHGAIPKTISDMNEELEKSELDDFGQVLADAWQKNQNADEDDDDDEFKGVDDVDDEESEDEKEEDLVEEEELNRTIIPAVKKEEPVTTSLTKRSVPDDKEKDTQVKKPKLGDTSLTNIAGIFQLASFIFYNIVTEHDVRAVFFVTPKITTTQLVKLFADRVNSRDKQVHFQQLLASLCIKVKEGDTIYFQLKPQK